jgi:tellurite resistance protein/uncharacterized protein (DUF697 family)
MNESDAKAVATVAVMAALADGSLSSAEQTQLEALVGRLGLPSSATLVEQVRSGQVRVAEVVSQLSDASARTMAYDAALAVCSADGTTNDRERSFLSELRTALGLAPSDVERVERDAGALASAPVVGTLPASTTPTDAALDQTILQQAMLTGALELLPDRLANIAILPIQLRLVYQVGQRYGQQLDANQVKDLAGTFGIGAAAQAVEGIIRKVLGGVASGLLGGLLGGATGVAAGAAVSFATTYALGHAAKQYYAQGRKLSADDLRGLFARFQGEAKDLLPKVQGQIQAMAGNLKLPDVLSQLRGV